MDYVTRELLDHGTLGPLIGFISVPKHLSQSQLLLSYIEEFRQMIVPDNRIIVQEVIQDFIVCGILFENHII